MISNLEYYKVFFVTANFLNITKASEHLFLTQSAVSQTIKKLESELNCSLFIRSPHGLQLTKEGEALFMHVKRAFCEFHTGEQELRQIFDYKSGKLKVGATETTLYFLLADAIKKFREEYPNINLSLFGSTTRDTCTKLLNDEIEMALLLSPIPTDFRFELTKIAEIKDCFVASEDFPIDFSRNYTIEELSHFPFIGLSDDNSMRTWIEQWFLEHNAIYQPNYTVRGTGLMLPLLAKGLGIALLPEVFIDYVPKENSLKIINTTEIPPQRDLFLAKKKLTGMSQIGNAFEQFFLTHD